MSSSTNKEGGPVLDEATFQKLLAAAYVLQEHRDQLNDSAAPESRNAAVLSDSDSTATLADIVETQHQIHSRQLDLTRAMNLVVERLRKITGAQGAAIGLLDQDNVAYRAGDGTLADQVSKTYRVEATLSAATMLHDTILRCTEAATDFRINPEIARQHGIGSLIAVPVFHNGKTAGALELVFTGNNAFHEHDVRTCQLMAGLVTEALTHEAEEQWRKGVAAERASMLQVLEKIKPQLARLVQDPNRTGADPAASVNSDDLENAPCQHCGHELAHGEVFCGSCGTSRASTPRGDLQGKWATLWNLKQVAEQLETSKTELELPDSGGEPNSAASPVKELPDFILPEKPPAPTPTPAPAEPPLAATAAEPHQGLEDASSASAESQPERPAPLTAAPPEPEVIPPKKPESRVWFRSIAVSPPAVQLKGLWQKYKGVLQKHPGDLALIAAGILFLITIIWAISSDHPTTSADTGSSPTAANVSAKPKRKQAPPAPKLTIFEQFLVSLGLAEAPQPPSNTGNPDVPVWVDVHTALYYCPGSDLYGKTPQGRIASQRDAQADQFEPASRKVCD